MDNEALTNQKNMTFGSPMESLWAYGKGGTRTVKYEACNCPTAKPEKLILTDHLMEQIITRDNLNRPYLRVTTNKDSAGVDSMTVDDLLMWCRENGDNLKESLISGTYKPSAVLGVKIRKHGGGVRMKDGRVYRSNTQETALVPSRLAGWCERPGLRSPSPLDSGEIAAIVAIE